MFIKTLGRSAPLDFYTPAHCKKFKTDNSKNLSFYSPASIYNRVFSSVMSTVKPEKNTTKPSVSKNPVNDEVDQLINHLESLLITTKESDTKIVDFELKALVEKPSLISARSDEQEEEDFERRFEATKIPEATSSVVPLTEEENKLVDRIFKKGQHGLVSQFKKVTVDYKDMYRLYPETWLNDEVVNFYFELLSERAAQNESYPSIHCFNTFFCSTLRDQGFAKVKRWTKRIDIFSKDFIFIPINQAFHWVLGVIDVKNKRVAVYDSLGGNHDRTLTLFLKYLQEEHMDKKKAPLDTSGWVKETPKDIPQQGNMSDCGAFTCTFAERISTHKPFNFSQEDMVTIRRRMALNILNKGI